MYQQSYCLVGIFLRFKAVDALPVYGKTLFV